MIIDLIIDRKNGHEYKAGDFYRELMCYDKIAWPITRALDEGEEPDVRKALCDYIMEQGYKLDICDYINSVDWL
jgi:hypothetical protein